MTCIPSVVISATELINGSLFCSKTEIIPFHQRRMVVAYRAMLGEVGGHNNEEDLSVEDLFVLIC